MQTKFKKSEIRDKKNSQQPKIRLLRVPKKDDQRTRSLTSDILGDIWILSASSERDHCLRAIRQNKRDVC